MSVNIYFSFQTNDNRKIMKVKLYTYTDILVNIVENFAELFLYFPSSSFYSLTTRLIFQKPYSCAAPLFFFDLEPKIQENNNVILHIIIVTVRNNVYMTSSTVRNRATN